MHPDSAPTIAPARPAGLSLRPMADADLPFLSDVYADSRAEELAPVPWPDHTKRDFLQQQFELQHAHYRSHYAGADFQLIEIDGQAAGRLYVFRSPLDIRLMDIALLRAYRRRGIATALLSDLICESEKSGIPISLHVEANNPVMNLYLRLDFSHVEDRGIYQFMRRVPPRLSMAAMPDSHPPRA